MTRSLLAAIFAGLLLASCAGGGRGGDGESAAARDRESAGGAIGGGHPVTIEAHDLYFRPKEIKVPPGAVDVTYVNRGSIYHTLKVDGAQLKGGGRLALEVNRKGNQDQGTIDLKPGSYIFYCDVPGHRVAGMETKVIAG